MCSNLASNFIFCSPRPPPPVKFHLVFKTKPQLFTLKKSSHNRIILTAHLSWCIIKLIASNSTAFFAFECCTFLDFGGSCALLRIVSRHSVRRPRTAGSSGEEQAVGQLHFAQHLNPYLRPSTLPNLNKLKYSDTLKTVHLPQHTVSKRIVSHSSIWVSTKAKCDLHYNIFQGFNIVYNIKECLK